MSTSNNFFDLGVLPLISSGSNVRERHLPEIPTIQIIKHPVIPSLTKYVNALLSKDSQTEAREYDPSFLYS
ncbi:hypothetical protein BDR04DRAFT_1226428 [Suillus decipiens]|nr:hypothetical protein BDR04DRAFT_1226428 [Suillus decipiens]